MGINNKYTPGEKKVIQDIIKIRSHMRDLRQRYLELDCKISNHINTLGGKYKPATNWR